MLAGVISAVLIDRIFGTSKELIMQEKLAFVLAGLAIGAWAGTIESLELSTLGNIGFSLVTWGCLGLVAGIAFSAGILKSDLCWKTAKEGAVFTVLGLAAGVCAGVLSLLVTPLIVKVASTAASGALVATLTVFAVIGVARLLPGVNAVGAALAVVAGFAFAFAVNATLLTTNAIGVSIVLVLTFGVVSGTAWLCQQG